MSHNLGPGNHPAPGPVPEHVGTQDPGGKAPASLLQSKKLWLVAVVIEVLHQGMSMVMTLANKSQAVSQIKDSLPADQAYTDQVISASVTAAAIASLVIAIGILAIVVHYARSLVRTGKKAVAGQKVLTYFAIYFVLRAILLFTASPTSGLPIALYAVDGVAQILVATLCGLGAIIAMNKESVAWLDKQVAP